MQATGLGQALSFESKSLSSVEWGSTFFLRSIMNASDLQDSFDYLLRKNKLIMVKHFHFVDEIF